MSMKPSLKTILASIVIAGCVFVNLGVGDLYYYGNLSTYTNSYFRYCIGGDALEINPDWLISITFSAHTIGVYAVDVLTFRLHIGLAQLIATLLNMTCVFLTYFSVQHSVLATLFTLNLGGSLTMAMIAMLSLKYAKDVMPERVGLASAIVSGAPGIGSLITNTIITSYINPDNLTPDVRSANRMYFSQKQILNNAPGVFIALGFLLLVLSSLGYFMQQLPWYIMKRKEKIQTNGINELTRITSMPSTPDSNTIMPETTMHGDGSESTNNQNSDCVSERRNSNSNSTSDEPPSLKPLEVIRQASFYQLFILRCVMAYGCLFILNYYKAFGQLWIHEDQFLASIGISSSISNIVIRVIIGTFVDRFGVKNVLVCMFSLNSVLLVVWYIAPFNRWLYLFCCLVLIGTLTSMYVLFPVAALKLYGPKYYGSNYALVMISSVVTGLVTPIVFVSLQEKYGYFPLVMIGSGLSALGLVALVFSMSALTM